MRESIFSKLTSAISGAVKWPLKTINREAAELIEEKTAIATNAVIAGLEDISPAVADLIAGRPIKVEMTHTITIRLVENPVDGPAK